MLRKPGKIPSSSLLRGLDASLAGVRAGGAFLADSALNRLLPGRDSNPLLEREAHNLVKKLGQLKGTYVKAGQMLAMVGEFVLPPELTNALHTLESATQPLPWSEVDTILHDRLGTAYAELDVDPAPIGVASLAQVHRATVRSSGAELALKFLYPGVRDSIDSDFTAMTRMLKLTRWLPNSRGFDDWMQQLRVQLLHEVNYRREADMLIAAGRFLESESRYQVPRVEQRYCRQELIAMEFLDGHSVTDSQVAALSQERRDQLAMSMLDLFFMEVFDWQLLQSDPNFGNYRIRPGDHRDCLALLDFGSVMDVGGDFFPALGDAIFAAQLQRREPLEEALVRLGCLREDSSRDARNSFADFCIEIMEPMRPESELPPQHLSASGQYRWADTGLMKRAAILAGRSATRKNFDLPSENFALVTRKLIGVFTFISLLGAEFNGAPVLERYRNMSSGSGGRSDAGK